MFDVVEPGVAASAAGFSHMFTQVFDLSMCRGARAAGSAARL